MRHYSSEELLSILEFFRKRFPLVPIAEYAAQMYLWSYVRRNEIAGLRWDSVRQIGQEVHFDITGKWRVRKWFRIPRRLFTNLQSVRDPDNPYVFAAYSKQLQSHHVSQGRHDLAMRVRVEFVPDNFGDWFYEQITRWANSNGYPKACVHAFRNTALQFAVDGAVINDGVAKDAGVHVEVMKKHYTSETERLLREKSNRTFERISQSLDQQVLVCFGYSADTENHLIEQLKNATFNCDWTEVRKLASQLEEAKGTVA